MSEQTNSYEREMNTHTCERCEHTGTDVFDLNEYAPFKMPVEWICEVCNESAYERQQERLMEAA